MSLKVVTRAGSSRLWLRGTVKGQPVFESTGTSKPDEAEEVRAKRERELFERAVYGAKAVVTFAQALDSFLDRRPDLSDWSKRTYDKLLGHFGEMKLSAIDQEALDGAYKALLGSGVQNITRERCVRTPLTTVLRHAARRKWCELPAFETLTIIKKTKPFLLPAQAEAVLREVPEWLRPMVIFLLSVGCRPGEAMALDWSQVDLFAKRVTIRQLKQQRGGHENIERFVDLPPVAMAALTALPHRQGIVFRPGPRSPREEDAGLDTFIWSWNSACARAGLPGRWREKKQARRRDVRREFVPIHTPHKLRHTWASWHYCVHRDLLKLRDDGGWANTEIVETYAKRVADAYRQQIVDFWNGGPALLREVG